MSTHQGSDRAHPNTSTHAKEHTPQRGPYSTQILQRLESEPDSIRPTDVLALQRTIGNRATGRLLQAKLKLGPAGDQYEQEADRVAQQVVRASRQPEVQRDKGDDGAIQTRRYANSMADSQRSVTPVAAGISRVQRGFVARPQVSELQREGMEDEELQASPTHGLEGGDVDADVARSIQNAKGGGQPLHDGVRSSMEQGFGADFSGVRVHTGGQADALNRSLNAKAFTTGKDIFFGKGQYNPGSSGGQELIAHELTHTVQQGAAGVQRQTAVTTNPTRTFGRAPGQTLIQRSEADAVSLANQLDPAQNPNAKKYQTWGDLTTARESNVAVIVTNWSRIADAYIKKSTVVFTHHHELITEADRMLQDQRNWTDPQARREASHILQQMVPKLATWEKHLKSPTISGQPQIFKGIVTRINELSSKIQQIQDKFLMAYRGEGEGSKKSKSIFSRKKRTVLSLPQKAGPGKGKLELFNKINPTTNQEVALGKGGMGYGRFGKLDGSEKFVKKQKLKKNEASIQAGAHKQVYALDKDSQDLYLSWIEQEMTKFRNELNYTTNILDHENVIKTHGGSVGVGSDNMPTAYMVMDMMQSDIKKMIEKDEWDEHTKIEIMKGVLAGLAHVHGKGLIHRDIKPENIMLDKNGVPKLIDFGEAVQMDHEHKFESADRAGTQGYQHPVKIKMKPILFDRNTDLYALKVTFGEMKPSTAAVQGWLDSFDDSHDAAGLLNTLKTFDIDD
ncbi:DUF4157 domain-containing protein [bacterium]|nr:DUF4157 domain-containing protein [bacterium]